MVAKGRLETKVGVSATSTVERERAARREGSGSHRRGGGKQRSRSARDLVNRFSREGCELRQVAALDGGEAKK